MKDCGEVTLARLRLPSMYLLYQNLDVFCQNLFSPDVSVQQVNKGMRMIATLAKQSYFACDFRPLDYQGPQVR